MKRDIRHSKQKMKSRRYFITEFYTLRVLKQNCNIGNRKEIFPFLCCPKKLLSFFGEFQSYKKIAASGNRTRANSLEG
jgi:hypothetical protein